MEEIYSQVVQKLKAGKTETYWNHVNKCVSIIQKNIDDNIDKYVIDAANLCQSKVIIFRCPCNFRVNGAALTKCLNDVFPRLQENLAPFELDLSILQFIEITIHFDKIRIYSDAEGVVVNEKYSKLHAQANQIMKQHLERYVAIINDIMEKTCNWTESEIKSRMLTDFDSNGDIEISVTHILMANPENFEFLKLFTNSSSILDVFEAIFINVKTLTKQYNPMREIEKRIHPFVIQSYSCEECSFTIGGNYDV